MKDYYILNGKTAVPCDLMTWGRWFEKADRQVANDTLGDARVSTVFLGLDPQYGEGPPLLFETLVFGGALDSEMERYSTWEAAEEGHAEMVRRVTANILEALYRL